MRAAIFYSGTACLLALAIEGLCAGGAIRQRFAELRKAQYMPPLSLWVIIGLFYYVICFIVLYRLFSLPGEIPLRPIAIALMFTIMLINSAWNWFFFRARNLFQAFVIGIAYTTLAVILVYMLLRLDRLAAAFLAPYLVYLAYANVWGYTIWKLNR